MRRIFAGVMLAFIVIVFAMTLTGCVDVAADEDRLRAVEPVIQEHVQRHPDQADTWEAFLRNWQESIAARKRD